jgi:hypothetical protein
MACPDLFGPASKAFKLLSERSHQKTVFNDSGAVLRLHKWTTAGRVYSGFICAGKLPMSNLICEGIGLKDLVAAFGLALATLLSCISPTTTDLHLFSMRTSPLKSLSTNSVLNDTSTDGGGVILYRRDTATNISPGIPDEYRLGISGQRTTSPVLHSFRTYILT